MSPRCPVPGREVGPGLLWGHQEGCLPQASRPDICCCTRARDLPTPSQGEGLLLRFFRRVYAPWLLHRVTRVVVVSEAGGRLRPRTPGRGLLSLTLPAPLGPVGAAGTRGPTPEVSRAPKTNQWGSGLCVHWASPHAAVPSLAAGVPGPVRGGSLLHGPHQRGAGSGAGPAQGEALCAVRSGRQGGCSTAGGPDRASSPAPVQAE